MRPVQLGPFPSTQPIEKQIQWLAQAVAAIAAASRDSDPNVYADDYTITNITESRSLNCDTATTAQLADVVATFLQDHQTRGSKRT